MAVYNEEITIIHQCVAEMPHCEEGQKLYRELMAALNKHSQVEWEWGSENAKEEFMRVHRARIAYYKQHIPNCLGGTL